MKLTKFQQTIVNRVIAESLEDALSGRMEEAEHGMEARVNHDVVADAIKNSENVKAIAREVFDDAVVKFEARIVKVIAQALRQNGIGNVSPADVDDVLNRSHAGEYEVYTDDVREQLSSIMATHAAELASLVVSALQDDDV